MLANYALTFWILHRKRASFQQLEEPEEEEGATGAAGAKAD